MSRHRGFPRLALLVAGLVAGLPVTRAAEPPRGDVVEVIVNLGTCTRFLAALRAADRVGALRGAPGVGTVFVPDDSAFERLPAGTLDRLLRPANVARLTALVDYHRVPDRALAVKDLRAGQGLPTADRDAPPLEISSVAPEGAWTVNGAHLLRADLPATNGMVHVIDQVLLPPSMR